MDNVVFVSESAMLNKIKEINKANNTDYTMVYGYNYTVLKDFSNHDNKEISYDELLKIVINSFNMDSDLYYANNKLIENGIQSYSMYFDLYHDQHRKMYIIYWQTHNCGLPKLKEEFK